MRNSTLTIATTTAARIRDRRGAVVVAVPAMPIAITVDTDTRVTPLG